MRVGIVGMGRWGRQLLRVFSSLDRAEVAMACDSDAERLRDLPAGPARCESLHELLADADVTAVIVATPPRAHAAISLAALAAGKHVFVEKPMAMSLSDAIAVRSAAERFQRRVMVGLVLHYHPAVARLVELEAAGALGTVTRVIAERGGGREPSAEHPAWWSLAPHDLSLARALFGSRKGSLVAKRTITGAREQIRAAWHPDAGRCAEILVDTAPHERRRWVAVIGTEGTAVFDDLESRHRLRLYRARAVDLEGLDAAGVRDTLKRHAFDAPPLGDEEPLRSEADHFVTGILHDQPFLTGLDHALDVVATLEAGQRSMRECGSLVSVPDWRTGLDQAARSLSTRSFSSRP